MDDLLKDCPFCGTNEKVSTFLNGLNLWSVNCHGCGIRIQDTLGGFLEKSESIKVWNTRPSNKGKDQ